MEEKKEFVPGELIFGAIDEYNIDAEEPVTTKLTTKFLEWLIEKGRISCEQLWFKKIHKPYEMYAIWKWLESYPTGAHQAAALDKLLYAKS